MSSSVETYARVARHIDGRPFGLLFSAIACLVSPDESLARHIAENFGIQPNASFESDLLLIEKYQISAIQDIRNALTTLPIIEWGMDRVMKKITDRNRTTIIVLAALAFVALWYLESRRSESGQVDPDSGAKPPKLNPMPENLSICLLLPHQKVPNLRANEQLSIADVEHLIEAATYFQCSSRDNGEALERKLDLSDAPPVASANPNVFLRIDLIGSGELRNANTQFALKRRLTGAQGATLGRRSVINSFNGLETFNRI